MEIKEITCKTAIGKCGFPGGGWAINPYVGCAHGCAYCYARFMKRFTGHIENWGEFVDARTNIAEVLKKQLVKSPKFQSGQIFIGTVTDPYQPLEQKYRLTRKILQVLKDFPVSVSILTKSASVLQDLDLLRQFDKLDVDFTINALDETWRKRIEPWASPIRVRLQAAQKLKAAGIPIVAMMGPFWPYFSDPEKLLKQFKKLGVSQIFAESFNTSGSNFTGVQKVLEEHYPELLYPIKEILFNKRKRQDFYSQASQEIKRVAAELDLPVTIFFGLGHLRKFD